MYLSGGRGNRLFHFFPVFSHKCFPTIRTNGFSTKQKCTKVSQQINHNFRGRLCIFFFVFSVNLTNYIPLFDQTPICPLSLSFRSHFLFFIFGFSNPIPPSGAFLSYPPPVLFAGCWTGWGNTNSGQIFLPKNVRNLGTPPHFVRIGDRWPDFHIFFGFLFKNWSNFFLLFDCERRETRGAYHSGPLSFFCYACAPTLSFSAEPDAHHAASDPHRPR